MPSNMTIYDAEIQIKYSVESGLFNTVLSRYNKDSLVESILKENNSSCVIPTGYLFCCNDVHISCIKIVGVYIINTFETLFALFLTLFTLKQNASYVTMT